MIREFLDFFDAPAAVSFDLAPSEAVSFFRAKGLKPSFAWQDVMAEEHLASFTVAKMMDTDMLADVHSSLTQALEAGTDFRTWADGITGLLQSKGWWGRQAVVDPLTGQTIVAQLGSPGRLKTIFRTNMQSAYAVGSWGQIQDQADEAPFLMYDAVDDHRTRPEHAAWDNRVYPIDSSFWKTHYPPNGWNCRCGVIQLSDADLVDLGLEKSPPFRDKLYEWVNPRTGKVQWVPEGVDPSFGINAGEKRLEALQKLALEKIAALPPELAQPALEGSKAAQEAAQAKMEAEVAALQKEVAKAVGEQQLARSITKTAHRSAQWQIDEALAANTPYLSKAIQQVQATKAGQAMTPPELLQAAKAQAAKTKDSAALANWKQQYVKGGKLPAPGQAVFDALPDSVKADVVAALDAQKAAIAADKAAKLELQKLAAGDLGKMEAATLKKLEADPAFQGLTAAQKLEQVKASVAAQKAAISKGAGLAGYKKAAIAGKIPTPAQKAAFEALTPQEQAALLDEVKAAKLAEAPPPVAKQAHDAETPINPDDLVQTGPQGGSNPGGEYTDTTTGVRWYIKYPNSLDNMRNEALANALYKLAGVEVPEVQLITFQGRPAIASRIIDGLRVDMDTLQAGRVLGAQEQFGVDAWLANWDVIGPDFKNTQLLNGRAIRIDPGGSLRYRAQGGLKGSAFGDEVLDLESMRNAGTNWHAESVMRYVTEADIEDGVRRILAIPEDKIRAAVEALGPLDDAERAKLTRTLLARREDLARKYPNARPKAPEVMAQARVTALEQKQIEASRINGYSINTDKGDIEDHSVVLSVYEDLDGNRKTRAALKVRPEAGEKLLAAMRGKLAPEISADDLKQKALELLKGINYRANKGELIDEKTLDRWGALQIEIRKWSVQIVNALKIPETKMQAIEAATAVGDLSATLDAYFKNSGLGAKAVPIRVFDLDTIPGRIQLPATDVKSAVQWSERGELRYKIGEIKRGAMRETSETFRSYGVETHYTANIDGVEVQYVPHNSGNTFTTEGYLQMDLDGVSAEASARVFATLERIGVDATRSTADDRLELYVDKIGYLRSFDNEALISRLRAVSGSQQDRIEAKLAIINDDAGFDIRTSKRWNPNGRAQAFGHGRNVFERPDLTDAEVRKFEENIVIYHNPQGLGVGALGGMWKKVQMMIDVGGQFASQLDRIRRGVVQTGSSVEKDFTTGGANYIYTRLLNRLSSRKLAGFYWKPKTALRLDAIAYEGDYFGRARESDMRALGRTSKVDKMIRFANDSSNETDFRDTLSLFDDLERLVLKTRDEYDTAIKWLKEHGYATWPDGRALEDVIDYEGSRKPWL